MEDNDTIMGNVHELRRMSGALYEGKGLSDDAYNAYMEHLDKIEFIVHQIYELTEKSKGVARKL